MGKQNNKKFKFPDEILNRVNECSNGGYVLFSINSEGLPEVFSEFDDPTKAMALQYYIDNWTKAIESLNLEMTAKCIIDADTDEEEPEDLSEI